MAAARKNERHASIAVVATRTLATGREVARESGEPVESDAIRYMRCSL
jgi:hypothetical protein